MLLLCFTPLVFMFSLAGLSISLVHLFIVQRCDVGIGVLRCSREKGTKLVKKVLAIKACLFRSRVKI